MEGDPLESEPAMISDLSSQGSVAIEKAYAELGPSLMRTAFLLCGSASIAEDLTQDVFEAAYRNWATIDDPAAYLRTAIINRSKNVYRSRDRHNNLGYPHSAVVSIEIVELRDSLLRLTYRQRAVVVLRYYVGIADSEIADLLMCSTSTVRSLARRAIAQLRKELSSW
jgi:RNA polymerase sigma factor (sigma-70 family)